MNCRLHVFLVIVLSCVTPLTAGAAAEQFKLREARYPDRGSIYVYRARDEGSPSSEVWRVAIDGYVMGDLLPGEYLSLGRKRGKVEVMVLLGERVLKHEVEVAPLAYQFLTVTHLNGKPKIVQAAQEEALPVLEQLSVAWPKRDLYGKRLKEAGNGVVLVRQPRIARGIRFPSDVQRALRGGKCHVAYSLAFSVDTSGFPQDVQVINSSQFTLDQVELMVDLFEDYRFHTYRENGKPVEIEGGKVLVFHAPYSECPTLPRDEGIPQQSAPTRGQYCPDLGKVGAGWIADELWSSVRECVEKNELETASSLFSLAIAYSNYDDARVADPTVTYLTRMMFTDAFRDLDPRTGRAFDELRASAKQGTDLQQRICEFVQRVGAPSYYPAYMIETGADHFLELGGESLEADFDGQEYWDNTLRVMKCNITRDGSN